jgi:hypothetical protein
VDALDVGGCQRLVDDADHGNHAADGRLEPKLRAAAARRGVDLLAVL